MASDAVRRDGADLLLALKVQPRARHDELLIHGGGLKLRITAPPVDGKANAHLQAYLARQFGVAKGAVRLLGGETGRDKRIRVIAPRTLPPAVRQLLEFAPVATPQPETYA